MQIEPNLDYHIRRARSELDLAYRADGPAAMESHLRLSALHMARLRDRAKRLEDRRIRPDGGRRSGG